MKPHTECQDGTSTPGTIGIIPADDFARWHVDDLIFFKKVCSEKGAGYAVYGADGTFLEVVGSLGDVIISCHNYDMELASVH
ncbi:MAG TPA: hypothetical protein QF509_03570 [Rhodospirillales bacterium]|jgi:hypothetical protein|nr:hypothetical protein [Rhodospirillales bacterium]|tara:strand:- start:213 stop:458 length:246 start_codon:yes stop_codon:yes gene_type:complete